MPRCWIMFFYRHPDQFYRHFERQRSSYLTDSREAPPHVPASPTDHIAGGADEDLHKLSCTAKTNS